MKDEADVGTFPMLLCVLPACRREELLARLLCVFEHNFMLDVLPNAQSEK